LGDKYFSRWEEAVKDIPDRRFDEGELDTEANEGPKNKSSDE